MSKPKPTNLAPSNQLLVRLTAAELKRFAAKAEMVKLTFGEIIYEPNDEITHVYFPNGGIISMISTIDRQSRLEIGMVGREGVMGIPVFLGRGKSDHQAIVQGAGTAHKIGADDFLAECKKSESLAALIRRYIHSFMTQVSKTAVCNRFHQVEARLGRWLLMTHDRMKSDEFQLTQKFLSVMLGVRREAVTIAALEIQRRGLVKYSRGKMKIIDRRGLESVSCSCYDVIRNDEREFLN